MLGQQAAKPKVEKQDHKKPNAVMSKVLGKLASQLEDLRMII